MPNTSATQATQVQHNCDKSATQVKKIDFDDGTSKNIFTPLRLLYMVSERLQGDKQLHSKNYLSEMPPSHAKMSLKSAPQKLNFSMPKDIAMKKLYTRL